MPDTLGIRRAKRAYNKSKIKKGADPNIQLAPCLVCLQNIRLSLIHLKKRGVPRGPLFYYC